MLSVTSLSCERAYRPLFSRLTFDAMPGEVVQVVGGNGAGKTTLLKILLGLYQDYEGEVSWSLGDYPLYVGHANGVKDRLRVRENLKWLCRLQGRRISDAHIADALEKVGLTPFATRFCGDLSRGQKKRLGLARLFLLDRACWVLDEPLSSIDSEGVFLLERAIASQAEKGGLVIMTSHQKLSLSAKSVELGPRC